MISVSRSDLTKTIGQKVVDPSVTPSTSQHPSPVVITVRGALLGEMMIENESRLENFDNELRLDPITLEPLSDTSISFTSGKGREIQYNVESIAQFFVSNGTTSTFLKVFNYIHNVCNASIFSLQSILS